jgi:hypothetical protein
MGVMTDPKQAWTDVGEHVRALALKLKLHYDEQHSGDRQPGEQPTGAQPTGGQPTGEHPGEQATGEQPTGEQATGEAGGAGGVREEIEEALSRLGTAVQDAFEALGRAAKDPAVNQDVKDVGHSLTEALGATFSEVSEDLRKAFNRGGGR